MKKGIRLLYHFLLLPPLVLFMGSCRHSGLDPVTYIKLVEQEPALNKTVKIGEIQYVFHVVPAEVMALKSCMTDNGNVRKEEYNARLKDLQQYIFIHIQHAVPGHQGSILKYKLTDHAGYEQRVMYYEFQARNDLRMKCGDKEIPPAEYQYENHMDIAPSNTMVMAFPKCGGASDWQIIFNDKAFSNFFIKVNFSQKDIDEMPVPALK